MLSIVKYWAPEIVAELLSLPSVCDRVNQWTAANHGGRVFWYGGTHFNDREYKTCGGGWHVAWRPFGGCGTAWVERWENGVKVDSMKFALSRDYALIDGALRRA